ncbi:MAG: ribonuclease P protein component [Deltaproteobacteria bacterium]|nr:ribonuclease P protein component [Deltaproteobacteria bacterium]
MSQKEVQSFFSLPLGFKSSFFLVKSRDNDLQKNRVAFAFSRKSGSAVLRNRFKRRFRHLICGLSCAGHDFFIIAKRDLGSISKEDWEKLRSRFVRWSESL